MKTFTDEQVTEAIEKVVAERGGDYVYDSGRGDSGCFYSTTDGKPSCIVGYVINELNPEAFEKVAAKESKLGQSWGVTGALWAADGGMNVSEEVARALQDAQDAQDGCEPWGDALESYKRSLGVEI